MKKILFALIALALTLSCTKEPVPAVESIEDIDFRIDINYPADEATRAVKAGWENGDEVMVFFNNVRVASGAKPKYIKFRYTSSGTWTKSIIGGLSNADLAAGGDTSTMTAVYFPYETVTVKTDTDSTYSFTGPDGKPVFTYYMTATNAKYTYSGGSVLGTLNMQNPEGMVQFCFKNSTLKTNSRLAVRHVQPKALVSIKQKGGTKTQLKSSFLPMKGYQYGNDVVFSGHLSTSARGVSKDYTLWHYYGSESIERWNFSGKVMNSHDAIALTTAAMSSITNKVDMGVTVNGKKVYWSKFNVGAYNTYDSGYYFSFAEIYVKQKYNSSTQLYPSYSTIDPASGHDAARENQGGAWRLPTCDEWMALRDACNMEPKTNYNGSGVDGILFTSKTTGNSIFVPKAGFYNGSTLQTGTLEYLSSTPHSTSSDSFSSIYYFGTTVASNENVVRGVMKKYYGFPVRAVCN
ncbi:MAG: hypothetical protein J5699_05190 [Bacteroidales bacterium]|nr:hypothetical protein [Bacteroidales bacterium]